MNFNFERTDLYLILLYLGLAVPIGLLDWDYDSWTDAFFERSAYVVFNFITLYVLVFVLLAKFLPERRFVAFFFWTLIFLALMGLVTIQSICLVYNCVNDPWSFQAVFQGALIRVEDVGLLAAFIGGKKIYDAQMRYVKMEKARKESELQSLKNQIDPHFLFNNLNTVDALIDSDPSAAKIYINKLSQLYRYLIGNKDLDVVPIEEELAFAQNYMYLITCRFGDTFQFSLENKLAAGASYLIPPGALQVLLENIVKHNQASLDSPILGRIVLQADKVIVSNKIQERNHPVDSTGTGLNNLKARFAGLTEQAIRITSNGTFTVELPLIKEVD
ncbi:MAG: histidine kinase [Saprospiraceae bacterium]|nr:histidine kinase [Saprospiraceae bacterium]